MNPPFHDEFVRLVALFYSGELTDEEWALLQVHMAYCDSCRETFEQYQHIASNVIPAMAASAAAEAQDVPNESEATLKEAGQRLMGRLEKSSAAVQPSASPTPWRGVYAWAAAACIFMALIYAGVRRLRSSPSPVRPVAKAVVKPQTLMPSGPTVPGQNDRDILARDDQKISALEAELSRQEKKSASYFEAVGNARQLLENEEAQQQQLLAQRDTLSQQLVAARTSAQALQEKLTAVENSTGQQNTRFVELQARIDHLSSALDDANTTLDSKDKLLAFDKDMMTHDRDIRDVIGARNLYIADIYDANVNGRTAKPFGRIFYTKDRSLVFYGFDLDKQPGLKQDVAFQVWGGSTDRNPVSLGLLYQDDNHNRWILKCEDATTLARLNSVFVTVEPPGGSKKPTGRRFLRAYLQIQPNHP